jgi:hypothetical protein
VFCQLYNIPNAGGWDVLSQLLANSPLMPNQHPSPAYDCGTLFKLHDAVRLEKAKADYLLELIDRCSALVTMWPYTDLDGKHSFGNLNLVREFSVCTHVALRATLQCGECKQCMYVFTCLLYV